jgi:tRNA-dependent cyclodipeptide synthase
MKIATFLNTAEKEVLENKFNIFIGISLGNKDFSDETIKEYLQWSLEHTKQDIIVLIPDKIHAINYEVKNHYNKERAMKVAIREGEKVKRKVENILSELNLEKSPIVKIVFWKDIESETHKENVAIIKNEFESNSDFHNLILNIVKEAVLSNRLTDSEYESLANYVLEELPLLITGLNYNGVLYELQLYPGLSSIDYLTIDLQKGDRFPGLTKKLNIKSQRKHLEAYAK